MFLHNPKRSVFGMDLDGQLIQIKPGVNDLPEEMFEKLMKLPRFKQKMITEAMTVLKDDPIALRNQLGDKINVIQAQAPKAKRKVESDK